MQHQKYARVLRYGQVLGLALLLCMGFAGQAVATSSSTHYSVDEVQFGAGGSLHDCSAHFCAKTSVGDTVAGKASSSNYSAVFGSNTTDEPLLEVLTTAQTQDMGTLDATHTGTATMSVKIRSYLSNGYVLQIAGAPPGQGRHRITPLATPTTSHQGAEQFGVNLVANNSPGIGADPIQVPSNSYSFGVVADDYITPDLFKYVEGDTVAQSSTSSGETDYMVSMILNVSNTTPGGHYSGTYSAVVVPLY